MITIMYSLILLILPRYLPITATSVQQPLPSVPKVAVLEWFDCN